MSDEFSKRIERARRDGAPKPINWQIGAPVPVEAFGLIEDAFRIEGRDTSFEVLVESDGERAEWFVARCAPKAEDKVVAGVRELGFEAYAPKMRVWRPVPRPRRGQPRKKAVTLPLFTGYAFAGFTAGAGRHFGAVRDIVGFQSFIAVQGSPLRVPDGIVEGIRRMEADGQYDDTKPVVAPPKPKQGTQVKVIDGPLQGMIGIVDATPGDRIKVLLGLMGRVDLGLDQVQPIV